MKPSIALSSHRHDIRRIVTSNRGWNTRIFGSVLHGDDKEGSDLALLIDAAEGLSLFDMAEMSLAIEGLGQADIDIRACLIWFQKALGLLRGVGQSPTRVIHKYA